MAERQPASKYSMHGRLGAAAAPNRGKKGQIVVDALLAIQRASGEATLRPEFVVSHASEPGHPLHEYFDWDDTEAAREWRLHQAHLLIVRIRLVQPKAETPKLVRAFVRAAVTGDGYEAVEDVMATPEGRRRILNAAFNDIRRVRDKYSMLDELRPLWRSVDRLANKTEE